jgi:hypothetical protein
MLDQAAVHYEMDRRREFVSGGMEDVRLLGRAMAACARDYRERLLEVAGDLLVSLGQWMHRRAQPHAVGS